MAGETGRVKHVGEGLLPGRAIAVAARGVEPLVDRGRQHQRRDPQAAPHAARARGLQGTGRQQCDVSRGHARWGQRLLIARRAERVWDTTVGDEHWRGLATTPRRQLEFDAARIRR